MRIDTYKENIKKALLSKQERINVSYYNAVELFKTVLEENPAAALTVSGYTFESSLSGGTFTVRYNGAEVSDGESYRADTYEQMEEILHKSIRKYKPTVVITADARLDVRKACGDFLDAYQGYYSNLTHVEYAWQTFTGSSRMIITVNFTYRIGRVKLTMMETDVNKKIAELDKQLFCRGMSNETKAFIAHNYLAKTVTYWLDDDAKPLERSYMQSAYGALINHKCVCQGYAEAYKRILDSQNITCEVICGKIKGSPTYHAWNVISFDGRNYYHVDVTWDAPQSGAARYKYYGLSDADLAFDRVWTRMRGVSCGGRENILEKARVQIAMKGSEFSAAGADREYFK